MRVKINNFVFPGVVLQYAGATAPSGYLICDGSSVSRTTYAALFAAIGTVHGTASGTHFNLPDYRGRFLRGSDNMGTGSASRDPDKATRTAANTGGATGEGVGTVQAADIASHNHSIYGVSSVASGSAAALSNVNGIAGRGSGGFSTSFNGQSFIQASGNNEIRPQNANINYIIKV